MTPSAPLPLPCGTSGELAPIGPNVARWLGLKWLGGDRNGLTPELGWDGLVVIGRDTLAEDDPAPPCAEDILLLTRATARTDAEDF